MKSKKIIAAFTMAVSISAASAFAGPTLTTLVNFSGLNGAQPYSTLVADNSGNLYGTTLIGGTAAVGGPNSLGIVFKFATATNTLGTIATFTGTNGEFPYDGVIIDKSGDLFGTTAYGGGPTNDGTAFEIVAGTSTITTLASFNFSNGAQPFASLVADHSGNLYGTTSYGTNQQDGTVFKIAAGSNAMTTLVTFNGSNGSAPYANLLFDGSGDLYGTTSGGGANSDGTVFKIAAGTNTLTTLATFNGSNGQQPLAGLITDSSGNLYGTTFKGGASGDGTVFKISVGSNTLTTVAAFNSSNGQYTDAGLIADAAGDLFGTTYAGGQFGDGTVFEIAAGSGAITTLFSFNDTDGETPEAGLYADASGNLFGTTYGGGTGLYGTVFELTGSGFVVPEPASLSLIAIGSLALLRRRRV